LTKYFEPKNFLPSALGSGKKFFPDADPGAKKAPDPESATLDTRIISAANQAIQYFGHI
jgi:hypothetical protein